jgi:hypothetical protein
VSQLAPHHAALERHLAWAQDFLEASDFGAAADALRDAEALSAEFRIDVEQQRTS